VPASGEEASLTKLRMEGKRDDDEEQEVADIVKLTPRLSLVYEEPKE